MISLRVGSTPVTYTPPNDAQASAVNQGPGSVYYKLSSTTASSSVNDGTLAPGQSATIGPNTPAAFVSVNPDTVPGAQAKLSIDLVPPTDSNGPYATVDTTGNVPAKQLGNAASGVSGLTDANMASANVNGTSATPSLRTTNRTSGAAVAFPVADADVASNAAIAESKLSLLGWPLHSGSPHFVHVAPDGNDANDGLRPSSAVKTIEHAIDLLADGGVVLLAPGSYYPARTLVLNGHHLYGYAKAAGPNAGATTTINKGFDGDLIQFLAGGSVNRLFLYNLAWDGASRAYNTSTATRWATTTSAPVTLPADLVTTFTINVANTTGAPASGSGNIDGHAFTYAGTTGTTFTGCTLVYAADQGAAVASGANVSNIRPGRAFYGQWTNANNVGQIYIWKADIGGNGFDRNLILDGLAHTIAAGPGMRQVWISDAQWFGAWANPTLNAPSVANQTTTLNGALSATATAVTLTAALTVPTGPAINHRIQVDSEIMYVTAGQNTTGVTVTRAADGTTAASHSNGATVTLLTGRNIGGVGENISIWTGVHVYISDLDIASANAGTNQEVAFYNNVAEDVMTSNLKVLGDVYTEAGGSGQAITGGHITGDLTFATGSQRNKCFTKVNGNIFDYGTTTMSVVNEAPPRYDHAPSDGHQAVVLRPRLASPSVATGVAWTYRGCRWYCQTAKQLKRLTFAVTTAASADDQVDIGLYSSTGALLWHTGLINSSNGLVDLTGTAKGVNASGGTVLAVQGVNFQPQPGTVYYTALLYGALGGASAATLSSAASTNQYLAQLAGSTAPDIELFAGTVASSNPLPGTLSFGSTSGGFLLAGLYT